MTVVSKENGTNLSATFKLYYEDKNGKLTEYKAGGQTQEYSVTAGQTISFNDLTLTDEKNEGIEYYLVETGIPEGYAASEKDAAGLGGINNAKKDTKEIDDKNQVVYGPFNFMDKIGEGESAEIRLDQSATINNVEQKVPVIVEKEDSYTGKHVAGNRSAYGFTHTLQTSNKRLRGNTAEMPMKAGFSRSRSAKNQTFGINTFGYPRKQRLSRKS